LNNIYHLSSLSFSPFIKLEAEAAASGSARNREGQAERAIAAAVKDYEKLVHF
jgi:hypothetical protein